MRTPLTEEWDVVVTDPQTGRATGLAATSRRAIKAIEGSGVPYCVIGAGALAAHGFPRMTSDIHLVVSIDDAEPVLQAFKAAKLRSSLPEEMHPDMLPIWRERLTAIQSPPPRPSKPRAKGRARK